MDIKDVSNESQYLAFLRQVQSAAERAARRKGETVRDHPPSRQLVSTFMMKAMAASFRPQSGENTIATTQVPAPYPPCIESAQDLEPIMISEMILETHHRGKRAMLRVLTPPDRMTAVMGVVEDENETAVLLQLYHQPDENLVPATEILGPGKVCIVKEPFFKCATDGSYSLRVDHPSDIIWLAVDDERIPSHWRAPVRNLGASSTDLRMQGNECVQQKKWAEALQLYSSAIQVGQTLEEKQLAFLNRSLTNLRLDRPAKAFSDVGRGTNPAAPSEKSLFREARALYELGNFQNCLEKLETLEKSFPENKAVNPETDRVRARLDEQRKGRYNFKQMYKQAKLAPPLIDCGTFSSPVEIRESPGRGRGLFTTKAVLAGELLLCEKAFSYSFAGDEQSTRQTNILMNLVTKKMTMGGQALLLPRIVQKLYHDSSLSTEFGALHYGDYPKVAVTEADGNPVVDSFLVEKIISLNSFGAPRTSRESFLSVSSLSTDMTRDKSFKHTTSGIWLLASRINHSCVGNCRRSFIGDMQIVRATRDLPAGTEVFFSYRPPVPLESYQEVQKNLGNWGFKCQCELCASRKATSTSVLQRRKALIQDMQGVLGGFGATDLSKARRLIKSLDQTYRKWDGDPYQLELSEPCFTVGSLLIANNQLKDAATMILKGLHALGYIIIAYPPDDSTGPPRLEVEQWGVANDSVPWAFFNLLKVYRQLAPELCSIAESYVELSYSMVVGEKETCREVFSAFV
ncbi:hypothetical protein ACJ41O_006451 [Fusarium nematophilum]